ncbi:hypothetical protein [Myroides odoratus]|uniref:hypothetical protein n=1 Tax=Myroides odoratus TaxID=256 RepID=UPI0039AEE91A
MMGLELISISGGKNYRPHFVIYPLYKKDLKTCLESPELMFEFFNRKGLQINLPYSDLIEEFKEVHVIVNDSLKISIEDDVSLEDLNDLIDDYFYNYRCAIKHPGKKAALLELKFYAALYIGDLARIDKILNEILNASKNWEVKMFEIWYGNFEVWFESLKKMQANRRAFLDQIEINKQDKKIAKLKSALLLI